LYLAVLLYFSLLHKLLKQHENGEKGYRLPISNFGMELVLRFSFQAKWLAEIAGSLLQWLMHKTNIFCIISIDTPIISTKRF